MRVERSLLICFVARSGACFLCGLIASTGVLGRPEEFFWMPGDRVASPDLGDVLRHGSTSNGVFSCKFQLGQWSKLLARARRGATDLPEGELAGRIFPARNRPASLPGLATPAGLAQRGLDPSRPGRAPRVVIAIFDA